MSKFRKKPVIIKAVQWNGKNFDEIMNFMQEFHGHKVAYEDAEEAAYRSGEIRITTVHGDIAILRVGDWVIPDGKPNTFYPCKPDIFEKTYEPI